MTVRHYTPEEKARLVGGMSQEAWEQTSSEFERVVRFAFASVPVMTQAAALHGLLCGNHELQDALDTIEHVCKQQPVPAERRPRPPYEQLTEDLGLYERELEQLSHENQTNPFSAASFAADVELLKGKLAAAHAEIDRLSEKFVAQSTRAGLLEAKLSAVRAAQEELDGKG